LFESHLTINTIEEVMNVNDLMTRSPINKVSSVVVNQCGCSSKEEFESILNELKIMKSNVKNLMSARKSKNRSALITQYNKDIGKIKQQLRPYFDFHRSVSFKSREAALISVMDHYLPKEVFRFLLKEADELV
jgi:hypothetical protein